VHGQLSSRIDSLERPLADLQSHVDDELASRMSKLSVSLENMRCHLDSQIEELHHQIEARAIRSAEALRAHTDERISALACKDEEQGGRLFSEVSDGLRKLQSESSGLEERLQQCLLTEERFQQLDRTVQRRLDEGLATLQGFAATAEGSHNSLNKRCAALEKEIANGGARVKECSDLARSNSSFVETVQSRLQACEFKIANAPDHSAKIAALEAAVAHQSEEQTLASRALRGLM